MLTIAALSPDDSERLEIELRVWFEVLVGQPVEGDVHMRYLVVWAMMMIKVFVILTMPTWWSRMDHSDGWYSFCWCEPL